eukprot:768741-Hanusia_phi.AAC.9
MLEDLSGQRLAAAHRARLAGGHAHGGAAAAHHRDQEPVKLSRLLDKHVLLLRHPSNPASSRHHRVALL